MIVRQYWRFAQRSGPFTGGGVRCTPGLRLGWLDASDSSCLVDCMLCCRVKFSLHAVEGGEAGESGPRQQLLQYVSLQVLTSPARATPLR